MKNRDAFVRQRSPAWHELDQLLYHLGGNSSPTAPQISRLGSLYRDVCSDLMRARSQGAGPDVTAHLDALAARAHNQLYESRPYRVGAVGQLLLKEFPRALRKNWYFFLASLLLFGLPMAVGALGALGSRDFAMAVLPTDILDQMAEGYSKGFAEGRNAAADAAMAGFYVHNNVGIAFRCFATGVLFGLGSIFFLVYNGLVIGTVLGHVIATGSGLNILAFISGHSAFELTAIVISGGAGLQMGYALIHTRGKSRIGSLRTQGRELMALISGAAVMLLIAAAIEGFWSPSSVPHEVKWAVGALNMLLVSLFLLLAGRSKVQVPVRSAT
jgi:uncharacterized membrane protein SpoIIM required for sporulation